VVDGVGLNITVMSYRDHLDFGIVADRDLVDDVWSMLDGCAARSRSASGRWGSRPGRRRGGRLAPPRAAPRHRAAPQVRLRE
jgi:diacylglycerol O-acyltransferase